MNPYIKEIEAVLERFPQRTSKQNPESYIGGGQSKLHYIGLRVPHLHQALRQGFSFSTHKKDLPKIWDEVWWNSNCYEVMSLALAWFYHPHQRGILAQHWKLLKKWSTRIDNWAHSDTLSGIYARILEDAPREVYPTLEQWNVHRSNPWLRRLSLVSLLYYSSQREKVLPLKQILRLVEPQLDYDHYYVQKGVGWTLRETYNVYPKPTYEFIEKHITRLSAPAFSAATEKMQAQQKAHLKRFRKAKR